MVEVAGGFAFHSLALLADAAHLVTDVAALALGLGALALISRPSSARHSYGLQRTEVLAAMVNAIGLLVVAAWIVSAAIGRLAHPHSVDGGGVLVIALVGLSVNAASAIALARSRGGSLNMAGAFAHMALDAVASAGTLAAGIAIVVWDARWADPAVSLGLGALVVVSAGRLLASTVHVLLEGTPAGMDPAEVERALLGGSGVKDVHHLHLWSLASDVPALSAHVVLAEEVTLHDAQRRGDELKAMLAGRFGIDHATLELECHQCEVLDDADLGRSAGR
ncbi:MAG: cobalt-zinc-cadmium efflux system protein [Acidimicrobiaceae bacterium]|nr:cobalt-zinc-cadmium efflux system protein [Acidimicrobiaceae bacterium]